MGHKVIKFNIYNFMEILSFFFNTMFDSIKVLRKKNNIKKIFSHNLCYYYKKYKRKSNINKIS